TPFKLVGPASGSDCTKTEADPTGEEVLGTLDNCAGCVTPWGTILSGEENFDQYFANASSKDKRTQESLERFGFSDEPSDRKCENFDDRFDVSKVPNEVNRFGYIVEFDPFDPKSTPTKPSATGRCKHEAGNIHITHDATVEIYSGADPPL